MLSLIVAMSEKDRVIGLDGDLPWKLSADLKRFKQITTGHTVVMGRKTWESIPAKFRPLPNRKNVVLSRQDGYIDSVPDGVGVSQSFGDALAGYAAISQTDMASEWGDLFVIGGESVFAEALPHADRIYLTVVEYEDDGDTFFPTDPFEQFEVLEEERVEADEKNSHASRFLVMVRKTDAS
jgi:dihydrofolate reductase